MFTLIVKPTCLCLLRLEVKLDIEVRAGFESQQRQDAFQEQESLSVGKIFC